MKKILQERLKKLDQLKKQKQSNKKETDNANGQRKLRNDKSAVVQVSSALAFPKNDDSKHEDKKQASKVNQSTAQKFFATQMSEDDKSKPNLASKNQSKNLNLSAQQKNNQKDVAKVAEQKER